MTDPAPRLPTWRVAAYGIGALGVGVFSTVPAVLLLFFCTEVLGMAPSLAGLAALIPKVWSLAWDPLVGAWSDRTRTPWGRRRPFLLVGALGVAVFFGLLFGWPYPQGNAAFAPVLLVYFLMTSFYSLFAVPFVAVPAEVSADPRERERVTAWRIGFGMVGVLTGAAAAPLLAQAAGGGRAGYAMMGLGIGVACAVAMLSSFAAVPARFGAAAQAGARAADLVRTLARAGGFWRLVAAYGLQLIGIGLVTALTPYWVVHAAGRPEGDAGLMLGVMFATTIATVPVWAQVLKARGAAWALRIAAVLYGGLATVLVLPAVAQAPAWAFAALGVGFGGVQVAAFARVAHLIHAYSRQSEGLFTGVWTAAEKVGLALGAGAAGLGLSLGGFVSGAPHQAPETLALLRGLIAFGPPVCLLASLVFIRGEAKDHGHG